MSKPPRRSNLQRNLARPIMLRDGSKLVTLRDAANMLLFVFGSVNTRFGALDHASRRLLTAAESGKREDIRVATHEIECVLRARRLLGSELLIRERSNVEHPSQGSLWLKQCLSTLVPTTAGSALAANVLGGIFE